MSSLMKKISQFAQSPKGRELTEKAKDAANDPKNKAKIQQVVNKVKGKGNKSY